MAKQVSIAVLAPPTTDVVRFSPECRLSSCGKSGERLLSYAGHMLLSDNEKVIPPPWGELK